MRMRRTSRLLVWAAAILGATLAGVTAASALTDGGGPDDRRPAVEQLQPRQGTTRVAPGQADPAGGPRWAVRAYDSEEGLSCVELGRLSAEGRYGRLEPDGKVTELPEGPHGVCGDMAVDPFVFAVTTRPAHRNLPARTVLYGLAGPEVETVSAGAPGRRLAPLQLSGERTFVVVADGLHPVSEFPVDVRLRDGRVKSYRP